MSVPESAAEQAASRLIDLIRRLGLRDALTEGAT